VGWICHGFKGSGFRVQRFWVLGSEVQRFWVLGSEVLGSEFKGGKGSGFTVLGSKVKKTH
jgi:hypothetical protein